MPHRCVKYSGTETNMTYMTYSQLKDSARARLKPVIGRFVGAAAIYYGLMAAANRLTSVSSVSDSPSRFGWFCFSFSPYWRKPLSIC